MPSLADQLVSVANTAKRAAHFAKGEYLPQMSRTFELQRSFQDAGRAVSQLEHLKPSIAALDGGDDGLRLAQRAIDQLQAGRDAIRNGVHIEDDILRNGAVTVDTIGVASASAMFDDASRGVTGIAALARMEHMTADDLLRGLTAG